MMRSLLNFAMIVGGLLLLGVVLGAAMLRLEQGEMLVRYSVRLALVWYTAALIMMMRLSPVDWTAGTYRGWFARWCWTWSSVCFAVHLSLAFHFYHF